MWIDSNTNWNSREVVTKLFKNRKIVNINDVNFEGNLDLQEIVGKDLDDKYVDEHTRDGSPHGSSWYGFSWIFQVAT